MMAIFRGENNSIRYNLSRENSFKEIVHLNSLKDC